MIIEFHLTSLEAQETDDHLGFCGNKKCEHLAHLFEDVTDGYTDAADVFAFVEPTTDGYQKRLQHNNVRMAREKWHAVGDADQVRALAIIRRGWDRLYSVGQA